MKRTPKIDEFGILLCPACGGLELHHGEVRVKMRTAGKDDADGLETYVDCTGVIVKAIAAKDMPGRRGSLTVTFWCEQCDANPVLEILQHKGSTYMNWEKEMGEEDARSSTDVGRWGEAGAGDRAAPGT